MSTGRGRAVNGLKPSTNGLLAAGLKTRQTPNALVLDEPTNHLDLGAIEELEAALEGFEGTVFLVTHDRRFLERFQATETVRL